MTYSRTAAVPLDQPYPGAPIGEAWKRFWKKGFTFAGRASRSEYWKMWLIEILILLAYYLLTFLLEIVHAYSVAGVLSIVLFAAVLVAIIPALALTVRRLHDANFSGGAWFVSLIPFVGSLILFVFTVLDSNPLGARFDARPPLQYGRIPAPGSLLPPPPPPPGPSAPPPPPAQLDHAAAAQPGYPPAAPAAPPAVQPAVPPTMPLAVQGLPSSAPGSLPTALPGGAAPFPAAPIAHVPGAVPQPISPPPATFPPAGPEPTALAPAAPAPATFAPAAPVPPAFPAAAPAPAPIPVASVAALAETDDDDIDATRLVAPRRAASGALLLGDGRRIPLVGTIIVGRDPIRGDHHVAATLLSIADPTKSVSKTHALLEIKDGRVVVTDLRSTNGTTVIAADGSRSAVAPGAPHPVDGNGRLQLGDYEIALVP